MGDIPADKFDAWTKNMHSNFKSYVSGMIPEDWYIPPTYEWTDELPDINGEED